MARRLPPLNSLKAFESAARLNSVTSAAAELNVTHGAISRHIQQLESWIGRPLFQRHNRRVELTEQGKIYLSEISEAFNRIAFATNKQLEIGKRRILRVNALATFSLRWLVPRLASFQNENPMVEIRLTTSNQPVELIEAEADVIIRGGPDAVAGYIQREFLSEVRMPVCSPRLLEEYCLSSPGDLKNHTLLHSSTYPTMWSEWLSACGQDRLVPKHSLTFEHFFLTLQGALDGLGVAMAPTELVADDVAEGRLIHPFKGPTLPPWRYFTFVPLAVADDAIVNNFCSWLESAGNVSR
jgi:LysR family glycine cleavage system transcriptional activator